MCRLLGEQPVEQNSIAQRREVIQQGLAWTIPD